MFTRKIDKLGRIVIPKDLRKKLDIKIGDNVDINILDNHIEIHKNKVTTTHHYKIINIKTNETSCYLVSPVPLVPEKICSFFGADGYKAISIDESEYKSNIEAIE